MGLWGHYIDDDVIIIWLGNQQLFTTLVDKLKINDLGLFFPSEIHREEISFLDLKIRKNQRGSLEATMHRKPTAGNCLLNWRSFHPTPLRKGIPIGQYLRAHRNCSSVGDFEIEAKTLQKRFRERGYPKKTLAVAYNRALSKHRTSLLVTKNKDEDISGGPVRIIGTCDSAAGQIRDILNTFWPILKDDASISGYLKEGPSIVYRRGQNLHDRLVKSHYRSPRQQGTWLDRQIKGLFKCGTCKACKYMLNTKHFHSPVTGREYLIRDFSNCKTKGVVYLGICACLCLYVGKTVRELRRQVLEHTGDIYHNRDTSVARYMRSAHENDPYAIRFCVIEVI